MFQFLRKYQKAVFLVVTFFIVLSFLFYGSYGSIVGRNTQPNKEIGTLLDGSTLRERQLYGLIHLLSNGVEEGGKTANLLSDSFLHKEIILTGLGQILAEHYFDEIEEELKLKWKRAKNYAPYVHPYAPMITARSVWEQFAPKINTLLDELKEAPMEFTKEQLPLLFQLYSAQAQFHPYLLLQVLYHQQGDKIRPDRGLPSANLSLFGFESIEDWFGTKFMEKVSLFLFNAACIAKREGYKVTKDEAEIDLLSNVYRGMKNYLGGKPPTNEEAHKQYSQQIRYLGLDENLAVSLWKEVLIFKRHMDEVGNAVFVDRLALNQFKDFAKASSKIEKYSLPKVLQFADPETLVKFEVYLETVSILKQLPGEWRPVDLDYPELLEKTYTISIATTSKTEVARKIGLKQTWAWEVENFDLLKETFPFLQGEDPYVTLDALDEKTRFRVDEFARRTLVEKHPEWIEEHLLSCPMEEKTLTLCLKEEDTPLTIDVLEKNALSVYTPDEEQYYFFEVLKKSKPTWISFEKANADGTLDALVDRFFMKKYMDLETDKSYEELKNDLIQAFLLEKLGFSEQTQDFSEYAKHYFDDYLKEMREKILESGELSQGIFPLEKNIEEVAHISSSIQVGDFSNIENGEFFRLLEQMDTSATDREIAAIKEHLKRDAQREFMHTILKKF